MNEWRLRLKGLVLENWGLKLLSFVIAALLWMFVVGEKRIEVSLAVPLELSGVPDGVVVVSRLPDSIRVRLSGPRTLLAALNQQQLSVALDLKGIEPGSWTFENLPSRMRLPKRVEVTYISPALITLEADQKVRKTVTVKPRFKGDPPRGFHVGDVRVEPPEIEVEGSARALRALREVPTETVDIAGLQDTMHRPVEVAFPDPTLRRVSKGHVELVIEILEQRIQRQFAHVPVEIPNPRFAVSPAAVTVRVEGGARAVQKLAAGDLVATVEEKERAPGRASVRVVVRAPEGVRVIETMPRNVELKARPGVPAAVGEETEVKGSGSGGD